MGVRGKDAQLRNLFPIDPGGLQHALAPIAMRLRPHSTVDPSYKITMG